MHEQESRGCLSYALFAGASIWVIGVSLLAQGVGWLTDQVLLIQGSPLPWIAWPLISWGHGLLLALVVVPLAIFTRTPRLRAAYQSWMLATGCLLAWGLARAFPSTWTQAAACVQIVISGLLIAGALLVARRRGWRIGPSAGSLVALLLAPLLLVPWLLWGSLGSPLDSLLNLLAAGCLGVLAGLVLGLALLPPLLRHSRGPGWDLLFGGWAAGATLLIMAAGFGFGGSQLLLALSLAPLGFAAIGLSRFAGEGAADGRAWLPLAALVALAAAGPLLFVDPDELALILGGDEILQWAFTAAGVALLLALALGAALAALGRRGGGRFPRGLALGGVAATWLLGLLLYTFGGQPGFYGERLFVILQDQADLAPLATIAPRDQRLQGVYTTLTSHADSTQSGLRATLDRLGVPYQPYYLVNAIEVDAGPLLRIYLAAQPEVDRILDSPQLRPLPAPLPVSPGDQQAPAAPPWNIRSIGADRVWSELGVTGEGIVVGQSDSGVQGDHPALYAGYRGRDGGDDYNWLDPWSDTATPTDLGGHGTHTLGSVLGRGGIGVAPGAQWFGCRNLERNLGNPALYLDCLQFMLAPYPRNGDPLRDGDTSRAAHVLNNSWGCPPIEGCDADTYAVGVRALRTAGIFVVASAGNEGPDCSSVSDPIAIYDDVFSVGAVDEAGDVASFSSRGPVSVDGSGRVKPDIIAPGVDVLSSLPGSSYGPNDGTSMAGPHVAGVVALMWSANGALIGDIERTEQLLIATAQPFSGDRSSGCFSGATPSNAYGYGLLDAYGAVRAALDAR